ncbi:hypothetical protein J26TS2_24910 [Shouchella clausii]|nr:hypothetical protein [Shouchella tritolerans]GIN12624.1 hypothetical protein J26TS2_24910 [Shouchella clausii]
MKKGLLVFAVALVCVSIAPHTWGESHPSVIQTDGKVDSGH